jgi:hypothetical protein
MFVNEYVLPIVHHEDWCMKLQQSSFVTSMTALGPKAESVRHFGPTWCHWPNNIIVHNSLEPLLLKFHQIILFLSNDALTINSWILPPAAEKKLSHHIALENGIYPQPTARVVWSSPSAGKLQSHNFFFHS